MITNKEKELIKEYEKGRVVFLYPRLKLISLNGGKREPLKEGLIKIKECLKRDKEKENSLKWINEL